MATVKIQPPCKTERQLCNSQNFQHPSRHPIHRAVDNFSAAKPGCKTLHPLYRQRERIPIHCLLDGLKPCHSLLSCGTQVLYTEKQIKQFLICIFNMKLYAEKQMLPGNGKMPAVVCYNGHFPIERREVEKRIYRVGKVTAHGFRRLSWLQDNLEL